MWSCLLQTTCHRFARLLESDHGPVPQSPSRTRTMPVSTDYSVATGLPWKPIYPSITKAMKSTQ